MKEREQWHELEEVNDSDGQYIIKRYVPNSYEIKNELYWLTSRDICLCSHFQIPRVVDVSIQGGYIKMERVDNTTKLMPDELLPKMIDIAVELHSVIRSAEPRLRSHASASEFIPYLRSFTKKKIKLIQPEFKLNPDIERLIFKNLGEIVTPYFSVVHRDFRYRHVLQSVDNGFVLIDWEFSNISHFCHDLAKLVCDYVVNHGFHANEVLKNVIGGYSSLAHISDDLIFNAVKAFIPLVLLEHVGSFVQRKCSGYMEIAKRDIDHLMMFIEL